MSIEGFDFLNLIHLDLIFKLLRQILALIISYCHFLSRSLFTILKSRAILILLFVDISVVLQLLTLKQLY